MRIDAKIDDHFPRIVEDAIHRRAALKLSRFGDVIQNVSVTLKDVNGPRGGVDMLCCVRVSLRSAPAVIIQETATSPRTAITGAFDRAARTVARRTRRKADAFKPARRRAASTHFA